MRHADRYFLSFGGCEPAAAFGGNDHRDWRVVGHRRDRNYGIEAMIDNRTQVFDVAMKNARTIEACVDRLAMIGADHELKLVAQRLSRLTFRAASSSEVAMSASRE